MFIDALLLVSDAQALVAGTTPSTNAIDLSAVVPKRQVGTGEPLALFVSVDVLAAGATDTFSFAVVSDDAAALSSPTVLATVTIPKATLVAGYKFAVNIPVGAPIERYIGARYIVGAGDTITVTAAITPLSMIPATVDYAKNYVV